MAGGEAIAPVGGNNTQSVQLVDLDQDGIEEAVAFFRDRTAAKPLKIAIFRQTGGGSYELSARIEGAGDDIESIEYRDLLGDQSMELLISWQVTPMVHTLVAYSVEEGEAAELMRSGFTRYLSFDITANGKTDLLLLQLDSAEPAQGRVELYTGAEGAMEFQSAAPLSAGNLTLQTIESGRLLGDVPALFVTSIFDESRYITDVFALADAGLRNITTGEAEHFSLSTLRHFTNVALADINGDGILEIPLTRAIPAYHADTAADTFWEVLWTQFDAAGQGTCALRTYHNNSDRWYLKLPDSWDGAITLARREYTTIGERAVVFSHWTGDSDIPPEPFLSIYRLTGNTRQSHATQDKRFILRTDTETIYAAEFHDAAWNCGLDKDSLIQRFFVM
jgi:hypothetical protein